jgi:hypothetical protein
VISWIGWIIEGWGVCRLVKGLIDGDDDYVASGFIIAIVGVVVFVVTVIIYTIIEMFGGVR